MDKYINTFNTIEDYGVNWENILSPSVSYIKSTKKVIYDAEYTTDKTLAKAGWIVYDNNGVTEYYNPKSADVPSLTASNIIGIVVIEANRTDDGTVRVVSLDYMSYDTPTTGSTTAQTMYWGGKGSLVPNLNFKNKIVTYVPGTTTTTLKIYGMFGTNYDLSSISSTSILFNYASCVENGNYSYISWAQRYPGDSEGFDKSQVPLPYDVNGNKNSIYYTYEDSILSFGLCGAEDTDKIMADVTHSGDILNQYGAGYHPAAECCRAYKDGQWYLPSSAELGYLCANLKQIEFTRTVLGRDSLTAKLYLSSSLESSNAVWGLYLSLNSDFGMCTSGRSKDVANSVLAFVAL